MSTETPTPAPASTPASAAPAASATPAPTPTPAASAPSATPPAATGNPLVDGARGDAATGADGKPAAASAPAPYVPEGLPEALRGATERETIDKLWKAQQDAPKPPATAADYKLELPKELEGVIDPASDKVLPLWRKIAHEEGYTQQQFNNGIAKLYGEMAKAGLIDPSVNIGSEFEALARVEGDRAAKIQDGKARVLAAVDQINALATRQTLTAQEASALIVSMSNRDSVSAVEKLLAALPKEVGVQPGGRPGGQDAVNDPEARALRMFPSMAKAG